MSRLALLGILVVFLVTTVGCGSSTHSEARRGNTNGSSPAAVSGNPRLADLRDLAQLRSLFNTRSGEPRLILLVSPT
jgi:hypothetical protein